MGGLRSTQAPKRWRKYYVASAALIAVIFFASGALAISIL
jgi:hypothetical protein